MASTTVERPSARSGRLNGSSQAFRLKLVAFAVAMALALAAPYALSSYLVGMLTLGLIFSIYAMSVNLLAGFGGLTNMGMGGLLSVGAYAVGYSAVIRGQGFAMQLLTALVVGLIITAIFSAMAMRVTGTYFLMVTLAQGMIVWGLANRLSLLGSDNGLRGIQRPEFLKPFWIYYYVVLAVVLVVIGAVWVVVHSPFGLSLRGLRNSPTRLEMLGYSTVVTRFYVFMIAGSIGVLSGVLFAYFNQFVSPAQAAFLNSGKAVLMAITGGLGTFSGPVVGALIITLAENYVSIWVTRWPTLLGVVFVFIIIFAPNGIVGSLRDAYRRSRPSDTAARPALEEGAER
jgi:branched-chain amino acid transport system permease protein